ncbi:DUF1549 and DUF1553 domain-containing protein [Planctomicrobium sp. SH668]|uniref:DUF1549 and DUF1553 domain-containing protein n=1 Tax=Planctomicrobium sp. SH668 TaxID=3448126 RepID=UPI003F5C6DBD
MIHNQASAVGVALLLAAFSVFAVHTQVSAEELTFNNDILPILSKTGCNGGGCHAKAGNGQNGFRLSLFGFEPTEDYEHIVKEGRGRRISAAAPEQSLLLLKATNSVPHGGGKRFEVDSSHYKRIVEWIEQGMQQGTAEDPHLVSLEVLPQRNALKTHDKQQLQVLATFSDQTKRDVTELAMFESNDKSMAECDETGMVHTLDLPGNLAVMVRFQGLVSVYNAYVPLGAPVENLPPPKNFIDEHVFANLKRIGIPPSPVCDDATFIRRVSLDITGQLPTLEQTREFLEDTRTDKREQLVETLLNSPSYADFFANKWSSLLKNRREAASDKIVTFAFHSWLRDGFLENRPYDQMVRELLGSTGDIAGNPPVAWYKRVKQPERQLEDVAQLFLGVRMQCAQCHHHPFERWSQDDYYGLSAFFIRIGRTPTPVAGEDIIFHIRGVAEAENRKTHKKLKPKPLGGSELEIPPDDDPRLYLVDWMRSPDNPYFAQALVNRYWKHFFKRGLIDPEDDVRDTNPPSNPELLQALSKHFVESGFDLKDVIRLITQSQTYQLSSVPNEYNLVDQQIYSRYYPRHLQAEVFLDAIDTVSGTTTSFADVPEGTLAISLPDNSYTANSYFLKVFGRPDSSSVCECERVDSSNLAQSLHLLNSQEIRSKLTAESGRAKRLATDERTDEEKIRELYLVALSREPRPEEIQIAESYLAKPRFDAQGNALPTDQAKRQTYEDLIWAILNTKEFIVNH